MAASDHLGVQFHRADESTPKERKREREQDAKGQDANSEFGYSDIDQGDYQWNRHKHGDQLEVF